MKARYLIRQIDIPVGTHEDGEIPSTTEGQKALDAWMATLPPEWFVTQEEFFEMFKDGPEDDGDPARKVEAIRRILEADSCACVWVKDYGEFMLPFWGTPPPGDEGWEQHKCRRCQALEVANG